MHMKRKSQLVISTVLLVLAAVFLSGPPASHGSSNADKAENRCGWFSNPTPGNASLYDNEGEWIIATQGGHQAEGDWPNFTKNQWVETNGHHGYGCACLRVRVNRETTEVIEIQHATARALSACRRDPALKKWTDFK